MISARAPRGFVHGEEHVRRLYPDHVERERDHFRRTGIHPIMHVVALRAAAFADRRWMIANLYQAFDAAKRHTLARMRDVATSYLPLPWATAAADDVAADFGDDPFPYGVEPNLPTLEAFLTYAHEQGVLSRKVGPEELFAPEVLTRYRV